jgi:3-oxoacyl-[acyl-carrier-protein] synthase II
MPASTLGAPTMDLDCVSPQTRPIPNTVCNDSAVPRRVAITGLGIITAAGVGVAANWGNVVAGRSCARMADIDGIGPVPAFLVDDVEDLARDRFGQRASRRMDRVGQLACLAALEALDQAGSHGVEPDRIAVVLGCVHGGAETLGAGYATLASRGAGRISPLAVPLSLTNGCAAAVARTFEATGPVAVTSTACAAGSDAIGAGLDLLRTGRADLVIAGGAEAPITPFNVAGYRNVGAHSKSLGPAADATRPFDAGRDGFVIGEGAGVIVMETLDHANARGASVVAEVAGYASTCDAGHLTDPDPEGIGAARAITRALDDAGVAAEDVSYINAHATSTVLGDAAEAAAVRAAGVSSALISSTKAVHGHGLGAAGGIEAAISAMALSKGLVPPTGNLTDPDPGLRLQHVQAARAIPMSVVISNSFGFGGHNACIVLRATAA